MQSKAWAIQELANLKCKLGVIYVLGGWLGTLSLMLFETAIGFKKVRSFDIDPSCQPIADQVNIEHVITDWRFKAVTKDMLDVAYGQHRYDIPLPGRKPAKMVETCDTIVNTCCDHVAEFARWWDKIPAGKLVLLQNNDFVGVSDHSNTVSDLDALIAQAPMTKLLFQGTLPLAKCTRFMLIGIK